VPNYTRALGRALEVVPAGAAVTGASASAPGSSTPAPNGALNAAGTGTPPRPDGVRESFRAAIQVTVR
jgi:hypothetical protein